MPFRQASSGKSCSEFQGCLLDLQSPLVPDCDLDSRASLRKGGLRNRPLGPGCTGQHLSWWITGRDRSPPLLALTAPQGPAGPVATPGPCRRMGRPRKRNLGPSRALGGRVSHEFTNLDPAGLQLGSEKIVHKPEQIRWKEHPVAPFPQEENGNRRGAPFGMNSLRFPVPGPRREMDPEIRFSPETKDKPPKQIHKKENLS